ncbi:hypothetical protein ACEU6E_03740 [Halorutilales archaeon Cl-col2-1]
MDEASRKILSKLREGRNVVSNLSRDLGLSEEEVRDALDRLEESGDVTNFGGGLYGLSEKASESGTNSTSTSDVSEKDHEVRQAYAVLVGDGNVEDLSPGDVAVENWANKIGVSPEGLIKLLSELEN